MQEKLKFLRNHGREVEIAFQIEIFEKAYLELVVDEVFVGQFDVVLSRELHKHLQQLLFRQRVFAFDQNYVD